MAVPRFAPVPPLRKARAYSPPDVVPPSWKPDRPADHTFQPVAERLGYQGPDQGFALKLARCFDGKLHLQPGEHRDDAVFGCVGVGLRRASLFGRAPVIHDLTIAFTIWGFLDPNPPKELVEHRAPLFEGVSHTLVHYDEGRKIVDMVPETTLRMAPADVQAAYPSRWKELLGR